MDSRIKGLLALLVIVLAVLVVVLDGKRRSAEARLNELMVQSGQNVANAEQNKERAREIVTKVKQHFNLPDEDGEPTVAAIVDVEQLRKQNAFYSKAENGDYLIVTTTRAVLYDPEGDRILDVAPVQLQKAEEAK
jgi:uncharacterized protein YpuA (DUF1002 family)